MSGGKGGADPLPPDLWTRGTDEPPIVEKEEQEKDLNGWFTTKYKPEYCLMVYKLLGESDEAKTICHATTALQCSTPTFSSWRKKYPEFDQAVREGLKAGEQKWRAKLREHAFEPSARVNNGLIKLLSSNVYGMKEEPTTQVTVVQQNVDPELYLKERGIPLPGVDLGGVDDVTDHADLPEELE